MNHFPYQIIDHSDLHWFIYFTGVATGIIGYFIFDWIMWIIDKVKSK